jgi:hypothetical protein
MPRFRKIALVALVLANAGLAIAWVPAELRVGANEPRRCGHVFDPTGVIVGACLTHWLDECTRDEQCE